MFLDIDPCALLFVLADEAGCQIAQLFRKEKDTRKWQDCMDKHIALEMMQQSKEDAPIIMDQLELEIMQSEDKEVLTKTLNKIYNHLCGKQTDKKALKKTLHDFFQPGGHAQVWFLSCRNMLDT